VVALLWAMITPSWVRIAVVAVPLGVVSPFLYTIFFIFVFIGCMMVAVSAVHIIMMLKFEN
jgi:hypothetical protein